MVSTKASPRLSRSSSHWLIWGNCSICRHFLLLPLRFPPPPVEANRRYFLIPAIAGLPATLSVVQRPSGSSLGPVHSERPLGPSFCMQHTLAGFQDTHGPQAILLGAPRLDNQSCTEREARGTRTTKRELPRRPAPCPFWDPSALFESCLCLLLPRHA